MSRIFSPGNYLSAPNIAAYNLGTGPFMVCAWMERTALGVDDVVLAHPNAVSETLLYRVNTTNVQRIFQSNGTLAASQFANASGTVAAATWTHIAVTWAGAGGAYNFYINGVLQATVTPATPVTTVNSTLNLLIGRSPINNFHMAGRLAFVNFWNVVKPSHVIRQIRSMPKPELVDLVHCVGSWHLTEDVANPPDSSIYANAMVPVGTVTHSSDNPTQGLYSDTPYGHDSMITLLTAGDIATRKTLLTDFIWGQETLPTTLPDSVDTDVVNPLSAMTNVSRVDKFNFAMSNAQVNEAYHFIPAANVKNQLVILNPGHAAGGCVLENLTTIRNMKGTCRDLVALGYDVVFMFMPNCGDPAPSSLHAALFTSYADVAMHYFLEPTLEILNYMDANHSFTRYNMLGFSGGGWQASLSAALDDRLKISYSVSGSMPGMQFVGTLTPSNPGNYNHGEGLYAPFYTLTGYYDLYIMASYGEGRKHVNVVNRLDSVWLSEAAWNLAGNDYRLLYGQTYDEYIQSWRDKTASSLAVITPSEMEIIIDEVATTHQVSSFAEDLFISDLLLPVYTGTGTITAPAPELAGLASFAAAAAAPSNMVAVTGTFSPMGKISAFQQSDQKVAAFAQTDAKIGIF